MRRITIAPQDVQGHTVHLRDPAAIHYLVHVLRARPGDAVECVDGVGRRYATRVNRRSGQELLLEVLSGTDEPASGLSLWLVHALIRQERFDWLVQKATELGIDRLTPVVTARSIVRLSPEAASGKVSRWQRIAKEAVQQCGRSTVPQIDAPVSFNEIAPQISSEFRVQSSELVKPVSEPRTPSPELILMPTLEVAGEPLAALLRRRSAASHAVVLIGPEGDFTAEEVALAQRHGAIVASLGRRVLRSETAAIAVLAVLRHAAGEL